MSAYRNKEEDILMTPEEEAIEYSSSMKLTAGFYNPLYKAKIIDLGHELFWYEPSYSPVDPYRCSSVSGLRFSLCSEMYCVNWEYREEGHKSILTFTEGTAERLCQRLGVSEEKALASILSNVRWLEREVVFTALDYI